MDAVFFKNNRHNLQTVLNTRLVILTASAAVQRSNDASYEFEQDANFWYLSGIGLPGWIVVIEQKKSWLIAPDIDEVHRIFNGDLSPSDAKKISGVDEVLSHDDGEKLLKDFAKKYQTVATLAKDPHAKRYDFTLNPAPGALYRRLKRTFRAIEDCRLPLAKLRAIKQPEEITAIRRAVDVTVEAFEKVKDSLGSFKYEYQVEAEFTYYFRSYGAKGHAYDPIVASGNHACTLHYTANNAPIHRGELLLLDIGARHHGYAADITRTYAVGKSTQRQREVHRAVESAHREIIGLLKPGLAVVDYAKKVDEIMRRELEHLELLGKDDNYRKYFPHAVSHGLGIDVHDALGRPAEFQEGMVLTVEPGIYIPEEGIGVRIEDDILITRTGHENLSAALPTSL